jgi:hypothetical protein
MIFCPISSRLSSSTGLSISHGDPARRFVKLQEITPVFSRDEAGLTSTLGLAMSRAVVVDSVPIQLKLVAEVSPFWNYNSRRRTTRSQWRNA